MSIIRKNSLEKVKINILSYDKTILGIVGFAPRETYLTRTIKLDALQFLFLRFSVSLASSRQSVKYSDVNYDLDQRKKARSKNQKTTFGPKYVKNHKLFQ